MQRIGNPMAVPELNLQPEQQGGIELSKDMQQTLALLAGYWRNNRVLLKASPTGVLFSCSPQTEDVVHVIGDSPNYDYVGGDVKCSELLVMGDPDNTGRIWVKPHAAATDANGWPLEAGDVIGLSLTNLNMLNIRIVTAWDHAIFAYTM